MSKPSKASSTRELLVSTALAILTEGEEILTMDAVVKRSGISKGGLVHHFPTKEALLEAAVEESIRRYSELIGTFDLSDIGSPEEIRAYIEGSLTPEIRKASIDFAKGMLRSFGSDFRENTPVMAPWRKLFASRLEQVRQSGDMQAFAKAAIRTLVVESFIVVDVLGLYTFTDTEMEAIKQELLR